MFRLFECCALSFFERFVLSFSLKIERFVSDSAEIWICGLYIGRRCVGNVIDVPIETSDMSMDRRHCIINVKRNKQGVLIYTLRDAPSLTGTFLNNEILGDKDRIRIEDGAIVTIGATTFILRAAEQESL